jgi:general secretion pathway protein F
MPQFRYEAVDPKGATIEGMMDALSAQDALQKLSTQSMTPIQLVSLDGAENAAGNASNAAPGAEFQASQSKQSAAKVGSQEQILIIRELATLLRAGIPLADAIDSLAAARAGTPAGAALARTHRALNAGETFVAALSSSGITFPNYVTQLAATGEMTGKLAAALADAAKQLEYDERVRQEMRNALTYPVILVVAGVAAILTIFLAVVPRFANFLKGAKAGDIPEISIWVINAGVFLKAHWLWFLIAAIAAAMLFAFSVRDVAGRTRWLDRLSRIPLIGGWLKEAETGRWATTLGALLANRVPIIAALELSAGSLRFPRMRDRVGLVTRDVRGGATLADASQRYGLVGATGVNLIRVGEKSGELAATVTTLGELSMEAGRNRMKRFLAIIEPAAILLIGAVIALVMLALMGAIYGIGLGRT